MPVYFRLLDVPVVPDVYKIYKGSFASIGTHLWASPIFNASSHTRSISTSKGAISIFRLWNIIHLLGLKDDDSIAEFRISLYLKVKVKKHKIGYFVLLNNFIGFQSTTGCYNNFWFGMLNSGTKFSGCKTCVTFKMNKNHGKAIFSYSYHQTRQNVLLQA